MRLGGRSHHDEPALVDGLGRENFIDSICHVISDCQPPKGIAISGYWGSGKTSALQQVYCHLSGQAPDGRELPAGTAAKHKDGSIVAVWFEAWRYQHEALPIVALLNEIRSQLGLWEKFREDAKKIGSVVGGGVLYAFETVIKAASGGLWAPKIDKLRALGTAWEAEHYLQPLPAEAIRRLLEKAIDQTLASSETEPKKLVIFIDDLDRCEPTVALRLLEGVKTYLNLRNCVTVFGMDQRQIERALIEALKLEDREPMQEGEGQASYQAREYLEKICQDMFHLPLPSKETKATLLCDLLNRLEANDPYAEQVSALEKTLKKYDCLPASPRKIKALANRLTQLLSVTRQPESEQTQPSVDIDRRMVILLAICVFYCFHRTIYEQLQAS